MARGRGPVAERWGEAESGRIPRRSHCFHKRPVHNRDEWRVVGWRVQILSSDLHGPDHVQGHNHIHSAVFCGNKNSPPPAGHPSLAGRSGRVWPRGRLALSNPPVNGALTFQKLTTTRAGTRLALLARRWSSSRRGPRLAPRLAGVRRPVGDLTRRFQF